MKYDYGFNMEKFLNNVLIIIGASLIGMGMNSFHIGLGVWFTAFALLPSE